jgi:hypothetical protein
MKERLEVMPLQRIVGRLAVGRRRQAHA